MGTLSRLKRGGAGMSTETEALDELGEDILSVRVLLEVPEVYEEVSQGITREAGHGYSRAIVRPIPSTKFRTQAADDPTLIPLLLNERFWLLVMRAVMRRLRDRGFRTQEQMTKEGSIVFEVKW